MTSHFAAIRVRPASRHIARPAGRSFPPCWLLAEWPPHASEPTGYWLSTLPEDTPTEELARLAKIRWRIEHDYRELKTGLGLDHFEGRSYLGWHRHVTLAALAQAFCTMLRTDPKTPAPGWVRPAFGGGARRSQRAGWAPRPRRAPPCEGSSPPSRPATADKRAGEEVQAAVPEAMVT
jgi:hypothetical protein